MKNSKEYTQKTGKLYRLLKKKHGKVKRARYDEPIEGLVHAILSERMRETDAKRAIRKIKQHFVDFNDLRESSDYIKIDATAFRALENVRQPVIAAVNGAAIGYGCKVAIVSDITVASDTARFSLPGANFGAVHMIMLGRAREVVGRKRLAQMLMTGMQLDAATAEEWGIVNQVVPRDEVLDSALVIAQQISTCPPLSIEVIRRMMHRGNDDDYRWEDLLSPGLLLMEDLKEGQRAFLEGRKPQFKGK